MKQRQLAPRAMAIGGSALIIISALFEYVRMHPDYRFIVEPWSLRGYETTQGKVVVSIGIGLLLLSLVTLRENASLRYAVMAAGVAWLAAMFIADLADPEAVDLELAAPVAILLTAVASWIVVASVFAFADERLPTKGRSLMRAGAWIVITLIVYLALVAPNVVSSRSTVEVPVLVAVAYGILLLGAVAGRPRELATVRVLLVSVVGGWIYITTMAGSVRSSLVTEQMETGIAASYMDTQITSGIMIAFIAALIVFAGAAGIWAERRDRLTVLARAKRQHEAALESAAELESAV